MATEYEFHKKEYSLMPITNVAMDYRGKKKKKSWTKDLFPENRVKTRESNEIRCSKFIVNLLRLFPTDKLHFFA